MKYKKINKKGVGIVLELLKYSFIINIVIVLYICKLTRQTNDSIKIKY